MAYFFKNDKEQALKNFTIAIKYAKDTIVNAYYYRGNLLAFYKEDYKKALSDYTKCINIAISSSDNYIHLTSLAEVFHNRAIVYYKLGDNNSMIKDFHRAIFLYEKEAIAGFDNLTVISKDPITLAKMYSEKHADELIVFDLSMGDKEHEEALDIIKEICENIEIPVPPIEEIERMGRKLRLETDWESVDVCDKIINSSISNAS